MAALTTQAAAFQIFGFKFFESEADIDIADPLRYVVTFDVVGEDEDLEETLRDVSILVADEEQAVSGSLGLLTKARNERELLVAALYEEARYQGVVNITIEGTPLDALPIDAEFAGLEPVPVVVSIEAGPTFKLGRVGVRGDVASIDPARFGLLPGGDAGSDEILEAEARMVRSLEEEGRPLAAVAGRDVVADHKTLTLDVALDLAAGPIAGYGVTTVEGTVSMDPDFTAYMTGLERGEIYSPDEIERARERLLGLGVFSSVALKEGESLDEVGQLPILVEVSERKLRYFGLGASISTTEGAGIEGYWGHRNLFGRAETLRVEGRIGGLGARRNDNDFTYDYRELDYNASVRFEKPGVIGPDSRYFAELRTVFEHPEAYDRLSARGSTGVTYELTPAQKISAEFALEYAEITDPFDVGKDFLLLSTPLQHILDNRDNRLNPTEGFRTLAYVEPTYDALNGTVFVKLRGEASAYQAFDADKRFVAAARLAGGSILGAELADVPADRRFYSGGGGSVRGYAFQGIGPMDEEGNPTGGVSFLEASVELRIGVTEKLGIVPFLDFGTVSTEQVPDFSDFRVGAGVGLRYLTAFGPLRLDVAVPLNRGPDDPSFGIYAGIGQSF